MVRAASVGRAELCQVGRSGNESRPARGGGPRIDAERGIDPAARSARVLDMHWVGNDAQIICYAHDAAGMELSTAPQPGLTLDGDLTAGGQGLGSAGGSTGELESYPRGITWPVISTECITRKALQV